MKRKIFLKNGLLGLSSIFFSPGLTFSRSSYPYLTLTAALKASGFDPKEAGCFYFAVTADVHYGSAGDGMMDTIDGVNQMDPLPAFFCVNGDLIMHGSSHFGHIPNEKERIIAKKEFNEFKIDVKKLNQDIPLMITMGNHDTHPKEIDPEMFWEVFPGYPPYQSLDIEGVHLVFLNGHSTGYIDSTQEEWLRKDIEKIPDDRTIIIFVHQPSLARRVRERGIPDTISRVFKNVHGQIWLIGGHEHRNDQEIFKLRHTTIVEHYITCGTINIWGGPEKPGYWIYCIRDGQVFCRIYKQRADGFRIESSPSLIEARKIPLPFEGISKDLLWKVLVGEGDKEFLVKASAEDCLNYWTYVKELVYRFPNKKGSKRFGILSDYKRNSDRKGNQDIFKSEQYFISKDLNIWSEINVLSADSFDNLIFNIPEGFEDLNEFYFKFSPKGETAVAGLFLLSK